MRRSVSGGPRAASLLTGLAVALAACGGGGGGGGDGAGDGDSAAKEPTALTGTVVWWDTSGENEQPVFDQLIDRFEEKYPNITVKHEAVPFGEAENKFKTAAQAGNAPDVLRSDVGWTPGFVELRYLQELDGTPALENFEDFLEPTKASVVRDGKTYGVPQVTDAMALLYNKKLLLKTGVTEPPRTWGELASAAAAIEDKTGVQGFAINGNDPYHLLPYIYGNGGNLVTEDGKVVVNDPASVEGIRTQIELGGKPGISRDITQNAYANVNNAGFQEGKVAMVINGPWFLADLKSKGVFKDDLTNLGIAQVPGATQPGSSPIGGHNYVVYRGSDNKDASYLFVQFMSTAESQSLLTRELGLIPTRSSAYNSEAVQNDQFVSQFQPLIESATPRPPFPGDFFTPLKDQFAKNLDLSDVQPAADRVAQTYQQLVEDAS